MSLLQRLRNSTVDVIKTVEKGVVLLLSTDVEEAMILVEHLCYYIAVILYQA